jgi:hypothetical protein
MITIVRFIHNLCLCNSIWYVFLKTIFTNRISCKTSHFLLIGIHTSCVMARDAECVAAKSMGIIAASRATPVYMRRCISPLANELANGDRLMPSRFHFASIKCKSRPHSRPSVEQRSPLAKYSQPAARRHFCSKTQRI